MEYAVVSSGLKISEIKPDENYQKYLTLVEQDIAEMLKNESWEQRECPACGSVELSQKFDKLGLKYGRCTDCFTVYSLRIPTQKILNHYYVHSSSRKYWQDTLWKSTAETRKEKLIYPVINWLDHFIAHEVEKADFTAAEICPIHYGFYDEWAKCSRNISVIEPGVPEVKIDNALDFATSDKFNAFFLFNALDRLEKPIDALRWSYEHLEPGGHCFITSILSTGFDSFMLGKNSKTLVPPERINSFSYEALMKMVETVGFQVLEFSTPGELDIENVELELERVNSEVKDFFSYVLNKRGHEEFNNKFQMFLQENRLSSRARLVLKKR